MSTSPYTDLQPPRLIREMLMTYGHNGGRRLTDKELADLLIEEILTLPDDEQEYIVRVMIDSDMPDQGNITTSSPVA